MHGVVKSLPLVTQMVSNSWGFNPIWCLWASHPTPLDGRRCLFLARDEGKPRIEEEETVTSAHCWPEAVRGACRHPHGRSGWMLPSQGCGSMGIEL